MFRGGAVTLFVELLPGDAGGGDGRSDVCAVGIRYSCTHIISRESLGASFGVVAEAGQVVCELTIFYRRHTYFFFRAWRVRTVTLIRGVSAPTRSGVGTGKSVFARGFIRVRSPSDCSFEFRHRNSITGTPRE